MAARSSSACPLEAARRHPGVTARLLTRDGALAIGIPEFGRLLQAKLASAPPSGPAPL